MHQPFYLLTFLMLFFACREGDRELTTKSKVDAKPFTNTYANTQNDSGRIMPDTFAFTHYRPPVIIPVPSAGNSTFNILSDKGERLSLLLKPPVSGSLPILKDELGNMVTSREGKPFILGDGGLSNFTNFRKALVHFIPIRFKVLKDNFSLKRCR